MSKKVGPVAIGFLNLPMNTLLIPSWLYLAHFWAIHLQLTGVKRGSCSLYLRLHYDAVSGTVDDKKNNLEAGSPAHHINIKK